MSAEGEGKETLVESQPLLHTGIFSPKASFQGSRGCVCTRVHVQEACSGDVPTKILGLPDLGGGGAHWFGVCPFWCQDVCQGGKEMRIGAVERVLLASPFYSLKSFSQLSTLPLFFLPSFLAQPGRHACRL